MPREEEITIRSGWSEMGLAPGDEFTVDIPRYPAWAGRIPRWAAPWVLRFVPQKLVRHRGRVPLTEEK